MFTQTADMYDLIYSFKDYAKEAQSIRDIVATEHPEAKTVLDVACGTAEHAKHLSSIFAIDGIDLQPRFVQIAQAKVPAGRFEVADMRRFDLGRRYDVVMCLFSSIGYLTSLDDVTATLQCFGRHLNRGGVILVEPWFTPEQWKPGTPFMNTVDQPKLKICRMALSSQEGMLSKLHFEYLVGRPIGLAHYTEEHVLGLYTIEQMHGAFVRAGLSARHDPVGIFGRGLYIARPR